MDRPLLFVDIDGVLNPNGGPLPDGFDEHWLFPDDDKPVRVHQAHGPWLHELAGRYDLVWATSWTAQDRARLAPVLNLPVFIGDVALPTGKFDPALKVSAIDRVAGDRPLAWIDDLLTPENNPSAHVWARARRYPTLLVPLDPVTGLTRPHIDELLAWTP